MATFRAVFSGPCAYLPNITGKGTSAPQSWSVLLPDIRKGWESEADRIRVDRHLPVLSYSPEDFENSTLPDAIVSIKDADGVFHTSHLLILDGHRITFNLPDAKGIEVDNTAISPYIRSDIDEIKKLMASGSRQLRSMDWLPQMEWLNSDLKWFGSQDPSYYFRDDEDFGYPVKGHIAAHVLMQQGFLIADQLDTVRALDGSITPRIWEFRPYISEPGSGARKQALAQSIALEAPVTERGLSITVAFSATTKTTLTLKADRPSPTIEIKNRELEEILFADGYEFEPQSVDLDFRYMYRHAQGYDSTYTDYLMPHWYAGGDGGNERGTCGGNQFSGFSDGFTNVIKSW